ncbi:MAG: HlyD family efflux transporter periplasmic adaptor subunit [Pirellulaceae bacterium]
MKSHIAALLVAGCCIAFARPSMGQGDFDNRLNQFGSTSQSTQSSSDSIVIDKAYIELAGDIDVPALESGPLEIMNVKMGQAVEADMVLAKINHDRAQRALEESQLGYELAYERANETAGINAAAARVDYANEEYQTTLNLYRKGSESASKFRSATASKLIAENDLKKAQNEKAFAAIEAKVELVKVNATKDAIDRHLLTSPIAGNVVDIKRQAGEWVNAGEPVFRVIQMDKLRIKATVEIGNYNPSALTGRPVSVSAIVPGESQPQSFSGTVVYTGLEAISARNVEVWAEVENRQDANGHWMLIKGMEVGMTIHLN